MVLSNIFYIYRDFMNKSEIKKIFLSNTDEKLSIYLEILLSKCKDIAKESNVIAVFMLILILLFYLTGFSQLESLQVGPVEIDDVNSIKIFIPLVFAFLVFRYIIISAHKAELHKIITEFSSEYFDYEDSIPVDELHMDDFTRSILPFSIYSEISKLAHKGKSKFGCFGAFLIFPISAISFIPFVLEYFWIKEFILQFETLNFYQKSSIVLSIWIIIISIYYFIHTMIISVNENK